MDLLIKHGTWIIVPIGLILSLVYLFAYPKIYPFLLARALEQEDAAKAAPRVEDRRGAECGGRLRSTAGRPFTHPVAGESAA